MKNTNKKITKELLEEYLEYREEEGCFYWKKARGKKARPGRKAGTVVPTGRAAGCYLRFDGISYPTHRLVWLLFKGELLEGREEGVLIHIDGDVFNNRIENLKKVSWVESQQLKRLFKNNTSGQTNVYPGHKGKFIAQIRVNGVNQFLGTFDSMELATQAVEEFKKEPRKKATKKTGKTLTTFTREVIHDGRRVIELETRALQDLESRIDDRFAAVVKRILTCRGKLIFCGMGKAGIVAQKVAGTFSSLGHPSFFMHAAEAGHGDLGMIGKPDLIFLFSNSGNTAEITSIIPFIKEIGSVTVGITGNRYSFLYKNVDLALWMGNHEEACGLGLAPTTSTTLMIALGDALAVSVLKQNRNFTEQRFAFNHPGGSLGRKLLRIKNTMRTGDDMVMVGGKAVVKDVIMAMTRARIGSAVVVDRNHKVLGIFSDGDLRRVLEKNPGNSNPAKIKTRDSGRSNDFLSLPISEVMTVGPKMVQESDYVMDALKIMSQKKIGEIPVVNDKGKLSGVVCLKDLV